MKLLPALLTPITLLVELLLSPAAVADDGYRLWLRYEFSEEIENIITARQCLACHPIDKPSVGPAYLDVAIRYRNRCDAAVYLKSKLKTGSAGVLGEVPMPAQIAATDDVADVLLQAILGLAQGVTEQRGTERETLLLSPATPTAAPGGGWEVAESLGNIGTRRRFEAE